MMKLLRPRLWISWLPALLLLAWLAPRTVAQGQVSPTEAMAVGNRHYEAGEFALAAEVYEAIVAAGIQDSALYYNLGNAYFKQGEIGRAILNYRRAQYLAPRDPDIANNLAVARTQTLDKLEGGEDGFLTNFVQIAEEWLTLSEASFLALFLWALLGLVVILAILRPRWRFYCYWVGGIVALFLLLGLFSMASRYYAQQAYPPRS